MSCKYFEIILTEIHASLRSSEVHDSFGCSKTLNGSCSKDRSSYPIQTLPPGASGAQALGTIGLLLCSLGSPQLGSSELHSIEAVQVLRLCSASASILENGSPIRSLRADCGRELESAPKVAPTMPVAEMLLRQSSHLDCQPWFICSSFRLMPTCHREMASLPVLTVPLCKTCLFETKTSMKHSVEQAAA